MKETGPRDRVFNCFDLAHLNDAEIAEGYHDGLAGEPCGDNRSRSFFHGWRNGMIDKGRMGRDTIDYLFARDFAPNGDTRVGLARVAYWRKIIAAQTRH